MSTSVKTKTPLSYYGGKQTMLKYIMPLIPKHSIYTESFCGGASVFFAKEPVDVEVLNDVNGELINFYLEFKTNSEALKSEIEASVHSRNLHTYATFIYQYPEFFSRVKRAWALWYLSKTCFASKLNGAYGYDVAQNTTVKKFCNAKEYALVASIAKRLENVQLECTDALRIISSRDHVNTFHFIDPPYIDTDCGHYAGYNKQNFIDLLELISKIKGKFMLTMFPHEILDAYIKKFNWKVIEVERNISASKTNRRKQIEIIVMNY